MEIGYRVAFKNEVGCFPADLVQISYWKRFGPTLEQIEETVGRCQTLGVRYVIHPVFTLLSETRPGHREKNREELTRLATLTDLGLIVHDETLPGGARLKDKDLEAYRNTLEYLKGLCPVSVENATNTADIEWFWREMGGPITLDVGHFEASGIDSIEKMDALPEAFLSRVDYVHMHHNNGKHGDGKITDHWPLTVECREVQALRKLLRRKQNVSVILEVNEMEQLGESLAILHEIRESLDTPG
jgi:sugar phosphate isomerase/epimerase